MSDTAIPFRDDRGFGMVYTPSSGTPWFDGVLSGTALLVPGLLLYVFPGPPWFCAPSAVVIGGTLLAAGIVTGHRVKWKLNKTT